MSRQWMKSVFLTLAATGLLALPAATNAQICNRTITADVVALDQVFLLNRLGACMPHGQMFALARDVVDLSSGRTCDQTSCAAGKVELRPGKRPRPLALRMNAGDCLQVNFKNLINPVRNDVAKCPDCINPTTGQLGNADEQPATRDAGVHVIGMQLVGGIGSDGSNVGKNASSLVAPNGTAQYTFYAEREGQHLLYSTAANTGGEGDGGQLTMGLFGSVNVEPRGARWYRSQVSEADMNLATTGLTPLGQPLLNYEMINPVTKIPVFNMLCPSGATGCTANEIVHSDLTAIIRGPFAQDYPLNATLPDRGQSFREFTIIYHDEMGAVQAFKEFDRADLTFALHSVRDAFAINYGSGGVGAEILANRLGLGPQANCTGCKYEEFFLTSWVLGDSAMVVDNPANSGVPATQAFFPDDPSNVYHSYLRDHTKFRILHAGPKEHHVHHLHAHQWLFTPDSDESAYLDSQAIGPGASFTLEIAYEGSGNRNQTVGDSIFHCHFYPHFAQGMWAMWRVHDVFEDGSRKLPDAEILTGTPSPGVVPIPELAMAPPPGVNVAIVNGQVEINGVPAINWTPAPGNLAKQNPGYPYFIPGLAGARPPHPPLDTIDDGGLPRHMLQPGGLTHSVQTRFDFSKDILSATGIPLAETGVGVELAAMAYHGSGRQRKSYNTSGVLAGFTVNGLPASPGAPYAEPCMTYDGEPIGTERTYKAANIQLDVIFNKKGWHFPQQRLITLWDDVWPTFNGERPPEPFFFRANSGDCITYLHTNLVPNVFELDDFQVRTPTDILGQHIHLVKFDVTASDGSANGWNYEDGTFSPDETQERIKAINAAGGLAGVILTPQPHPVFGAGPPSPVSPNGAFLGAQTTVQRWYADPVLNNHGDDRTLRTVFTHDHYGPSTHQQAGLYAGLVVEPANSQWRDPETGIFFGQGREDGGPTSWRADIITEDESLSYREFLLEYADFQLAYEKDSLAGLEEGRGPTFQNEWACHGLSPDQRCAGQQPGHGSGYNTPGLGLDNRPLAINPPSKKEVFPKLLEKANTCGEHLGAPAAPCPEAISADDPGTFVVNYRNEPIALRTLDPATGKQAVGDAGDLAMAFASITRKDTVLNSQPTFYPPLTGSVGGTDPFTPLISGFEHDRIQIRTLVGAHEEGHNLSVNGMKWLYEPSYKDSGFRNSQMQGISEHFEMEIPQLVKNPVQSKVDYLYAAGSATDDLWNGIWGLFRVFKSNSPDLLRLPNNPNAGRELAPGQTGRFNGVCPKTAPVRGFKVVATTAQQLLGGPLTYNTREPLEDPTALIYVRADDLDSFGRLKPGLEVEPLVLRANAGDCIRVKLFNAIDKELGAPFDLNGWNTLPMIVEDYNNNDIHPSVKVGLHPQLVHYDVSRSDGNNIGINQIQTANPGQTASYEWYAGDVYINDLGVAEITPIEFGATNLIPADRIKQPSKGAIGALIIEPEGSTWTEDADLAYCGDPNQPRCSRAAATIQPPIDGERFREFVLLFQDDLNLRCNGCGDPDDVTTYDDINATPNTAEAEDPEDSGQKAFNYKTEPMWLRLGFAPDKPLSETKNEIFTNAVSNLQIGGLDPETPIFWAKKGDKVRFRVLEPGGHARNHVFQVHGHVWQQEPYVSNASFPRGPVSIGDNPLSQWEGARMGHGPTNHFDAVLENGAGGAFGIEGDYLYRDQSSFLFDGGLWGLFRVQDYDETVNTPTDIDPGQILPLP